MFDEIDYQDRGGLETLHVGISKWAHLFLGTLKQGHIIELSSSEHIL